MRERRSKQMVPRQEPIKNSQSAFDLFDPFFH